MGASLPSTEAALHSQATGRAIRYYLALSLLTSGPFMATSVPLRARITAATPGAKQTPASPSDQGRERASGEKV